MNSLGKMLDLPSLFTSAEPMLTVLWRAMDGWAVDIRPMIQLTQSTPADHESLDRLRYEDLLAISKLDDASQQGVRPVIILVDDVLQWQTLQCREAPTLGSTSKRCHPRTLYRSLHPRKSYSQL